MDRSSNEVILDRDSYACLLQRSSQKPVAAAAIVDACRDQEVRTILDIGSGTGALLRYLVEGIWEVLERGPLWIEALEPDPDLCVQIAQVTAPLGENSDLVLRPQCINLEDYLETGESRFDLMVLAYVWNYLGEPDSVILNKLLRRLTAKGRLCITVTSSAGPIARLRRMVAESTGTQVQSGFADEGVVKRAFARLGISLEEIILYSSLNLAEDDESTLRLLSFLTKTGPAVEGEHDALRKWLFQLPKREMILEDRLLIARRGFS